VFQSDWPERTASDRRIGDAQSAERKYRSADHHDRREGRGHDPRRELGERHQASRGIEERSADVTDTQ